MTAVKKTLIVQKYGGATLADPEKIRQVALRIHELSKSGTQVVVVVSAMGDTTNQLLDLAKKVSKKPTRRELDMLLTTGERISMSLLSLALHDLGTPAISFTGSQAGILTDESHINASIIEIKPERVNKALQDGKVVVLAGFQGVSPVTKEITTLGRGGSDTTAVAMAAALGAERCEILKDVLAVYTADPKVVSEARPLSELSYEQLKEMTFWGAKVLHFKSAKMAAEKKVSMYVGPAHSTVVGIFPVGTFVGDLSSKEFSFSLNSYERVLILSQASGSIENSLTQFRKFLDANEIGEPQILRTDLKNGSVEIRVAGPKEIISAIEVSLSEQKEFQLLSSDLCSTTVTFSKSPSAEISNQIQTHLKSQKLEIESELQTSLSLSYFMKSTQRIQALESVHHFIEHQLIK